MSRRAPPPEYYEEDEYEFDREPPPRLRRRDRDFEDEAEYRQRRPAPPIKDLEGLRIRERPRGRDRVLPRRSREQMDEDLSESELEEIHTRPRPRRRSYASRDVDEGMMFDERERRRPRPRDIDEELFAQPREPRGGRRHLSREIIEEESILDDRERLPPRRRSRGMEEEDLILDEKERRGSRKHRPREIDEELVLDERDRRGSRRYRPRAMDEEEMIIDERKRRGGRKYRPPEVDEVEEEDLIIEEQDRRRPHRADRDLEEDMASHRREPYLRRPYDSEGDLRLRGRRFEDEHDDTYMPSRRRPRYREPELDEVIMDEPERDRTRGRMYREDPRAEEVTMRWKDRPIPRELDEDEELEMRETHRRRRRSHPEPRYMREPPAPWLEDEEEETTDDEAQIHPQARPMPHHLEAGDEEFIVHRGRQKSDRRRGSMDSAEIVFHREKPRSPPRGRSPAAEPVHAPPVHQEFITHHRHIDHGFGPPPQAPSPGIESTRSSVDERDIHHGTKPNPGFEEAQSDDESISPTSGPSIEFHNPWTGDRTSVASKPKSLVDDKDSVVTASSHARSKRDIPREVVIEEKLPAHDKSPLVENFSKDSTDGWSVVHASSKTEALEMTGALNIVEVAPKTSSEPEIEVEEEASHVGPRASKESKERRDERWTEITKDLVVREAIEKLGYEFEETRTYYYIFSYLDSTDIDELVELSDEIRQARRRRIREMQRERSAVPPRRVSLADRIPPRPQIPMRPRMPAERRVREREWLVHDRR